MVTCHGSGKLVIVGVTKPNAAYKAMKRNVLIGPGNETVPCHAKQSETRLNEKPGQMMN